MRKFDLIIVGAGPAGISCAAKARQLGIGNLLLIDQGSHFSDRKCAVDGGKTCTNCVTCKVISGFGGCLHYGDSVKLSSYPSGKFLYNKLKQTAYERISKEVLELFGIKNNFIETCIKSNVLDVKNYPICVLDSARVKRVIEKLYLDVSAENTMLNTAVGGISPKGTGYIVHCSHEGKEEEYFAQHLVIATGRKGWQWWRQISRQLGVRQSPPITSFGLRFEAPISFLQEAGRLHPDLKLRIHHNGRKFKTFCFCAGEHGGRLKLQNHGSFILLDGHLLTASDPPSPFGNFAILTQLIDRNEEATKYSTIYEEVISKYLSLNIEHPGWPIYQSYAGFRDKSFCKKSRYISVQGACNAPVWKLFNEETHSAYCEVAESVFSFIKDQSFDNSRNYNDYIENINVFALELENIWDRVEVDDHFMTSRQNLFVAGDCAGISQGVFQAAISGISVAYSIAL